MTAFKSIRKPALFVLASLILASMTMLLTGCATKKSNPVIVRTVAMQSFGAIDGKQVNLYTLKNKNGLIAKVTNYGATLVEMHTPDRDGKMADIVCGFDSLQGYVEDSPYFGSTVGRVANRIANGKFKIGEREFTLATNNGPNHLHGGEKGWDKQVWTAQTIESKKNPGVIFTLISPDGDEGYPGDAKATVTYTLTEDDNLKIEMKARVDRQCPINMAHHSYWNLGGHDSGNIYDHYMTLAARRYTPVDANFIPTGKILPVNEDAMKGPTPLDFRSGKTIGQDIDSLPAAGPDNPGGYDHNFVLNGLRGAMKNAAEVVHPESGRIMRLYTSESGLQFYSGNFLNGIRGKNGAVYDKHDAFCLESQCWPDAINKRHLRKSDKADERWPDCLILPNTRYKHTMVHEFRVAVTPKKKSS